MRFADPFTTTQEDTRKVKTQTTAQTVEVRADGEGLVSHAGVYLLSELAGRTGLTEAPSAAMAPTRRRRSAHDPGQILRDLAVSIADGGDCVSDLGVIAGQEQLFGAVASQSTAHRVVKLIDAGRLEAIRAARAKARKHAWDAGARPRELVLDLDATLIAAHSEKQGAAGNYKGGALNQAKGTLLGVRRAFAQADVQGLAGVGAGGSRAARCSRRQRLA